MPESAATAAVAFDTVSRVYSVVSDRKIIDGLVKGDAFNYDGNSLTVVEMCKSLSEAKNICMEKSFEKPSPPKRNGSIQPDNFSVPTVLTRNAALLQSQNNEHMVEEVYSGEATPESSATSDVPDRYREESVQPPHNYECVDVVRKVVLNMMNDFVVQVDDINRKYQEMREILIRYFGTNPDGEIVNDYSKYPKQLSMGKPLEPKRSLLDEPKKLPIRVQQEPTYFDELVVHENRRKSTKRLFESDEMFESPPAKKANIGRSTGSPLKYPFISREVEEKIFYNANNSYAIYAQQVSKTLFAGSLHLYFKDQDSKKRNWLHEAIDYRFPSEDKATHLLKWKNCSYYINKNMTIAAREKKEKARKTLEGKPVEINFKYLNAEIEKTCYEKANGSAEKYAEMMALPLFAGTQMKYFKEQNPVKKDWLRDCVDRRFPISDKLKRDQRWKVCAVTCNKNRTKIVGNDGMENPYPYFSEEIEKKCFDESLGSATQYCDLICKHLFPETNHIYFKDQDPGKRHWLHQMLDKRFPSKDKITKVAKWKCCTTIINKHLLSVCKNVPAGEQDGEREYEGDEEDLTMDRTSVSADMSETSTIDTKDQLKNESISASPSLERDSKVGTPASTVSKRSATKKAAVDDNSPSSVSSAPSIGSISGVSNSSHTSARLLQNKKLKKENVAKFTSYLFLSEEEELTILENCKGCIQTYVRQMAKILFKDTIKVLYRHQSRDKKDWLREIVDFRFPCAESGYKKKWKMITAAINKNAH